MPTWTDLEEINDVEMVLAGPPGAGITALEKTELDSRLTAVEGRGLGGLADVDDSGRAVGANILRWDSTAGVYLVEPQGATLTVADTASIDLTLAGTALSAAANFGTGAGQVAEGNHLHPLTAEQRFSHPDPAALPNISSGGDTVLITQTIGPFALDTPTRVTVRGRVYGEGIDDPANAHLFIRIDTSTARTSDISMVEPPRFEWGVNSVFPWEHSLVVTRTGAEASTRTVALGVVWSGGGSLDVKAAWMTVETTAYRS